MDSTKNYEMFKKHEFNRVIDQCNLRKIRNSIVAKNLLHLRPILVDDQFKVIDGQHRLEAAKLLEVPIYYQIEKKIHDEDIILLNIHKGWDLMNYLRYYSSKGNTNYINLKNFMEKHDLYISVAIMLLSNKTHKLTMNFREGAYKFPEDISEANDKVIYLKHIRDILNEKMIGNKKFINATLFLRALLIFSTDEKVNLEVFIRKLVLNLQWIRSCQRMIDYIEIFKKIYNFKNRDSID